MIRQRTIARILLTLAATLALPGCSVPEQQVATAPPAKEDNAMHASPAPEALPLPSLAEVRDEAGNVIDRNAVLGHWTVLWFYPAAATPG